MNRWLIGGMALALVCTTAKAQSLDDLNIQIHGYATQGFLYTTQNNILTTSSSNGSPARPLCPNRLTPRQPWWSS